MTNKSPDQNPRVNPIIDQLHRPFSPFNMLSKGGHKAAQQQFEQQLGSGSTRMRPLGEELLRKRLSAEGH